MDEVTNTAPALEPDHSRPRAASSATISWLRDLFVSVLIAVVVILFLYQPVKVEGTSMMPSLVDQERIFINKFVYRFGISEVGRGDTVVFWFPGDPTKSYIKRVIGVPGDTVEVRDGTVFVNTQPLAEPYVPQEYRDHISMPRAWFRPMSTSCSATIAARRTTAGRGAWCLVTSFTEEPCSCTGPWTGWV